MIVRNEELILAQAIASTDGLADEIVVLDTGSTDGTVALAESLGCKVLSGGDRMHKGQSRNQAMEVASGDWIVILDADERIADPTGLRSFLETTDAQGVYVLESNINTNEEVTLTWSRMLAWRRGTFQYKYRAHEIPLPVNGWGKTVWTQFLWEHRPPMERQAWKPKYFMDRLLLDVQENPHDSRPLYYVGRQYYYAGQWLKAVETFQKYLKMPAHDEADACGFMARCYAKLNEEKKQVKMLYRACAAQPERRSWWGMLAEIYHAQGKDRLAVGLLKCALEIMPDTRKYVNPVWYGPHIYDLLARCLWKLGGVEEGLIYARKAVELASDNERLLKNLLYFENNRWHQCLDCISQLRKGGRTLYVGANRLRAPECVELLYRLGHRLTLLEIFPTNAEYYRSDSRFQEIIEGDIRNVELSEYDTVFWWHGPEHISISDFEPTVARLEKAARKLVVLGSPWGHYEQGAEYGNCHEAHVAKLFPVDYERLGYQTVTKGKPNQVGSHILAWKHLNAVT